MSKSAIRIDRQVSIFEHLRKTAKANPPTEGDSKCINELRKALRDSIKKCSLSRHQIAGEMSHLLGETITKEQIDSWTRESDEQNGRPARHIPAEYLPAFCRATGANDCLKVLGEAASMFLVPGPEVLRAEIQKLDEEIREREAEKAKRSMFLKEMEMSKTL